MGCTISPILFVLAMQVLLKAAECHAESVDLGKDLSAPPLKTFMNDTTVIANKEKKDRDVLVRLDTLMEWSRMKFKPAKSRSLSPMKGKLDDEVRFTVEGQAIPTISEEPVTSSGGGTIVA